MEKTGIIWTEHTWNFIRARNKDTQKNGWFCTHVNGGCGFCYAETLNLKWGNGLAYTFWKVIDTFHGLYRSKNVP